MARFPGCKKTSLFQMPAPSFWDVFSYFGTYIYSMCFISQCSHRMDVHYPVSLYNRRLTFHYYTRNHISPRSQLTAFCTSQLIHTGIDPRWILFFPSPRKSYRNFQVPVYTSPASSEYALSAAGNPSSDPGFPICKNAYRIYFPSKKS